MNKNTGILIGLASFVAVSLCAYCYRDLRKRSSDLEEAFDTVLKLNETQYREKRISLRNTPPHIRLWMEHWRDGQAVGSTESREGGAGPITLPRETTVRAAAAEIPPGSGKLQVTLSFSDARLASRHTIDLPKEHGDSWFLRFFAGEIVVEGQSTSRLLAVWQASSAPDELEPRKLTSTGGSLEAWVLNVAFASDSLLRD